MPGATNGVEHVDWVGTSTYVSMPNPLRTLTRSEYSVIGSNPETMRFVGVLSAAADSAEATIVSNPLVDASRRTDAPVEPAPYAVTVAIAERDLNPRLKNSAVPFGEPGVWVVKLATEVVMDLFLSFTTIARA